MNKRLISSAVALGFLVTATTSVFAETPATPASDLKMKLQEKCERLTTNINTKITRYDNNNADNKQRFGKMKEGVTKIIERLSAKGYDTSKLSAALVELTTAIDKFATDHDTFIADLKDTKNFACDASQGQFMEKLKSSRGQLPAIREDVAAIRNVYQTKVRPEITALRDQVKASKNNQ